MKEVAREELKKKEKTVENINPIWNSRNLSECGRSEGKKAREKKKKAAFRGQKQKSVRREGCLGLQGRGVFFEDIKEVFLLEEHQLRRNQQVQEAAGFEAQLHKKNRN